MRMAQRFIRAAETGPAQGLPSVTLTLAQRRRSRQRLTLSSGEDMGLAIARGVVLHDGDQLIADDGGAIVVRAAREQVTRVTADSPTQLMRAAYHLGNRHVLLEVGEGYLQLEHDPVLVDMLQQLGGVRTEQVQAPFEPETGAYGGGHHHGHDASFAEDYALAQTAYHAHDDPTHGPVHDHGPLHGPGHGHS